MREVALPVGHPSPEIFKNINAKFCILVSFGLKAGIQFTPEKIQTKIYAFSSNAGASGSPKVEGDQ